MKFRVDSVSYIPARAEGQPDRFSVMLTVIDAKNKEGNLTLRYLYPPMLYVGQEYSWEDLEAV